MITESTTTEKEVTYPSEVTFKSVFRSQSYTLESIKTVLAEHCPDAKVTAKESKGGKFTSYTVTAEFPSEEVLQSICESIASLEGYMTLF